MHEAGTADLPGGVAEVLETITDTVILLDHDWRFAYLNGAALALARRPKAELLGRPIWEAYPELIGTPIEAAYRRAVAERVPVHLEAPGVLSGRWYDVHAYPGPGGLTVYGRDVTDRARAEAAVRRSELRYRTLAEASPVGLYHTDAAGRCVYVNGQWCRITGLSPGEAAGDGWARALHPEDRDRVFAEWRAAIAEGGGGGGGGGAFSSEYRFRRPDGTSSWVFGQGVAERDGSGRTVGFVGTVTDITDRKRAEQALARLNGELERRVAERTAELLARTRALEAAEALVRERERHFRELADHNGRLKRELEHRVGNHLAGLRVLVAEMRQRRADAGDLARAMEGRLVAMAHVNRLLTAGGWRPVSLRTVVGPLLDALAPCAPQPCAVDASVPDAALDPKQTTAVAMILAEWFTNSCKYGAHSVAGGRVSVRGERLGPPLDGEAAWLRLTWRERGGPPPRGPGTGSLATELVRSFAERELRGRCELTYPPAGAEHALEFPAGDSHATDAVTQPDGRSS